MFKKIEKARIPTDCGDFMMYAYSTDDGDAMPHLALVHEDFNNEVPVYVRIHSECMTGDVFGSKRCDCGQQLHKAMEIAGDRGGVIIYLRQEGRGIGLVNKMRAYNIQDNGVNTADANTHLGFEVDARQYDAAIHILDDLHITSLHLMTNNPRKIDAIKESHVEVLSRVPIQIDPEKENVEYLKTKKDLMGHMLK